MSLVYKVRWLILKDYYSCGQNYIKSILINIGLSVYIHNIN